MNLESLLTSPAGFGLASASPLQRAICRAADGLPIVGALGDEACEAHFGCAPDLLGVVRPALVVLVAGVRGGKSLLASAAAVKAALTADLSQLMPHEIARVAIIAPTVDNATATFRLLSGSIDTAPMLRALVEGEIGSDSLMLRREDGRLVEIVVVAAHRGAVTVRSRWLAGFVLDEVALFGVESTGAAVNAEELLRAAETRLVRGAQGWLVSSPYGPAGLLHDLWKSHIGKPGRVLVVHAPTRALNPAFDNEQIEAIRQRDPDAAAREYDASWIDADTAFFDGAVLDAATRKAPFEESPVAGGAYAAAWDAATRGNSWTLVVARAVALTDAEDAAMGLQLRQTSQDAAAEGKQRATGGGFARVVIAGAWQWTGSRQAPLDPALVIGEIAAILRRYGVREVQGDRWSADALRALMRGAGLELRESSTDVEDYVATKTMLATSRLELPPNARLVADLKAVRKRVLGNGVRVDLPRTADGRHCDFAPSTVLVVPAALRARRTTALVSSSEVLTSESSFTGFGASSIFDDSGAVSGSLSAYANDFVRGNR